MSLGCVNGSLKGVDTSVLVGDSEIVGSDRAFMVSDCDTALIQGSMDFAMPAKEIFEGR